jgi:hypothetical protein
LAFAPPSSTFTQALVLDVFALVATRTFTPVSGRLSWDWRSLQRHTRGRPTPESKGPEYRRLSWTSTTLRRLRLVRPHTPACQHRLRRHSCRSSDFSGLFRIQPCQGLTRQHPWDSTSRGFPLYSLTDVAASPPS